MRICTNKQMLIIGLVLAAGTSLGCDDGEAPEATTPVSPDAQWSHRFGDSDYQSASCVAIDPSGNVLIGGTLPGTADFGAGDLTSAGDVDVFAASFGPDGLHRWSRHYGDANRQAVYAMAVDNAGNVLVAGEFFGTVNFGGSDLTTSQVSIFLASFAPDGSHRWSKQFDGELSQGEANVAVDPQGNVMLAGAFYNTVNFGGSDLTSAGETDAFVASFDSNGNHRWSHRFGDEGLQYIRGVAVDGVGNVIVVGSSLGVVNLGGEDLTGSNLVAFVASFDTDGGHRWSKGFNRGSFQSANGVAVDAAGNALVMGHFHGTTSFGGGDLGPTNNSGAVFAASYTSNGDYRWSRRSSGPGEAVAYGIAVDGKGNSTIVGVFNNTVGFGGEVLTSAGGYNDVFIASFAAGGAHRWSRGFGDASPQIAFAVAADAAGSIVVAGNFRGRINFGSGTMTSAGGTDIFVVKFDAY